MDFYTTVPVDNMVLQQGDIVCPVPFIGMSLDTEFSVKLADEAQRKVRLKDLTDPNAKGIITTSLEMGAGLVLTQTCDNNSAKQDRPIIVCRIYECTHPRANAKEFKKGNIKNELDGLSKVSKAPSRFGLRPFMLNGEDLTFCVAHLLETQHYPPKSAEHLKDKIIARLSLEALNCLQERCTYLFSRFAADDDWLFSKDDIQSVEAVLPARLAVHKQVDVAQ